MTHRYTWRFSPRTYEIDIFGHVNNAVYANYCEEAANQASSAAGFDLHWYMERGQAWVIRRLMLRYHQPALYGDDLALETWVADMSRVQSHRDYDLYRAKDGVKILRGRANWVYVDLATHAPRRIPDEIRHAFNPPADGLEPLNIRIRGATPFTDTHHYIWEREVESGEIDIAGHVNNGVYLRWIENAYVRALESVGWGIQRGLEEYGFAILAAGHDIEYFKSARLGDRIKVVSHVVEAGKVRGAWIHEVRHAETDELMVRDYAVGAFLDMRGETPRPMTMPAPMMTALLTGKPS